MRLVFFGTPDAAVSALRALHAAGHDIVCVVTQPDRRRGRGAEPTPSPVKVAAGELGLPVLTPERSREVLDDVAGSGAELGVVVAFGQILPESLLGALPYGFVNVHFSLLPRWRGAAPVERALLAGDTETGVCIMALDAGLDTGPVYARAVVPIGGHETAGELRAKLVAQGTELLVATLPSVPHRRPEPQVGEATYADKLTAEEFELDWDLPATDLARMVRAGNPRPGAWTDDHGKRLKVWRARALSASIDQPPGTVFAHTRVATGEGALELVEVQPEGKRVMAANAWLAGRREATPLLGPLRSSS
ncbi:MAG: methionyl-tRNA formyltransferase [Acidimicrobiia bacterium]